MTSEATFDHASEEAPSGQAPGRAPAGRHTRTAARTARRVREIGGPAGPEPTRYGDWERKGRCIDF
jgi:hypothetical protein